MPELKATCSSPSPAAPASRPGLVKLAGDRSLPVLRRVDLFGANTHRAHPNQLSLPEPERRQGRAGQLYPEWRLIGAAKLDPDLESQVDHSRDHSLHGPGPSLETELQVVGANPGSLESSCGTEEPEHKFVGGVVVRSHDYPSPRLAKASTSRWFSGVVRDAIRR